MTLPYAEVIGDPIAQSKSPVIHRYWLDQLGIEGDYRAWRVTAAALADHIKRSRDDYCWLGCNVTIPHKQTIMPLVDRLDPAAKAVGAVNVVYRDGRELVGLNSDVAGVEAAIGDTARDGIVCVIGAGGAARAGLAAAARQQPGAIRLIARSRPKAAALLEDLGIAGDVHDIEAAGAAFQDAALVINASPLGMAGQPPLPASLIAGLDRTAATATVFDMVYDPLETAFLAEARQRGRTAVDGLVMLVGQAREAFRRFYSDTPPGDPTSDAALRARLTGH